MIGIFTSSNDIRPFYILRDQGISEIDKVLNRKVLFLEQSKGGNQGVMASHNGQFDGLDDEYSEEMEDN